MSSLENVRVFTQSAIRIEGWREPSSALIPLR